MESLLTILKDFSPISSIGLSLVIIYKLINQGGMTRKIKDNHLHDLPAMNDALKRIDSKSDEMVKLLTEINTKIK